MNFKQLLSSKSTIIQPLLKNTGYVASMWKWKTLGSLNTFLVGNLADENGNVWVNIDDNDDTRTHRLGRRRDDKDIDIICEKETRDNWAHVEIQEEIKHEDERIGRDKIEGKTCKREDKNCWRKRSEFKFHNIYLHECCYCF